MIRTIYWMIYFWMIVGMKTFELRKMNKLVAKGKLEERDEYVNLIVGKWARKLITLAGGKIIVEGTENLPNTNAVYVANHQGNFDIPIMLGHIGNVRPIMAKTEMKKMPGITCWMDQFRCIYVDRKDPKQGLKAVLSAVKLVRAGSSFTIFPEGTRSQGEEMGEFKAGSSLIAIKGGALIVPITIDGSYKLLEKNKGFKITPATVNVTIHKPLNPKEMSKEEIKDIDKTIKNIIKTKLP